MIRTLHTDRAAENVPGEDNRPAFVRYRGAKVAEIWHEGGAGAENLLLLATRLKRKNMKVIIIPAPRSIPAPNTTATNEVAP